MVNLKQLSRPLVLLYFLVAYVLICFGVWTGYQITSLNKAFDAVIEKERTVYKYEGLNPDKVFESPTYKEEESKYRSTLAFILFQGGIFIIIFMAATYYLHTGFNYEIMLNRQQRNFLLSITHELKSPIAGIKLGLETLHKRGTLDRDVQKRLINNSMKDAERLQGLVENLLMAAKIDNQSMTPAEDEVNLSYLVTENVNKIKETIAQGRVIDVAILPHVYVQGDRSALISIVVNLVENALKYSPATMPIEVSLQANGNTAMLKVADLGSGIPDKEKPKIFKKFYRIGNEDTRKTKGTGLGLFLVKQLTALHKGTIRVTDNQPHGSVFTVTLPCEVIPEDDEPHFVSPVNEAAQV